MTTITLKWLPLPLLLLLTACATLPAGPSVMVLPGKGKDFQQFHADDLQCQQFALERVGGTSPSQTAGGNEVASAVAGTAIGAAAGAIMGGHRGAAVGAGAGLLFGTVAGSENARSSGYATQQHYDNAYVQCMYASGHMVPMSGRMYMNERNEVEDVEDVAPSPPPSAAPPPPGITILPPPPGSPPPPPPGM